MHIISLYTFLENKDEVKKNCFEFLKFKNIYCKNVLYVNTRSNLGKI